MLRFLRPFMLLIFPLLLAACGLPSAPPDTVTDPALRRSYMRALEGDGDALYRVSRMYADGSHGFPRDSWYASVALDDAAARNQPQAVYDKAVHGLDSLRARISAQHAGGDSYKDWNAIEDELLALQREVRRAGELGDTRAPGMLAELDADMARYRELTDRERAGYEKCPRCLGEGRSREWREDAPRHHNASYGRYHGGSGHYVNVECPRCRGRGFVRAPLVSAPEP